MKKYSYKQIYQAVIKAVNEDWNAKGLIDNISRSPYNHTAVKLGFSATVNDTSCRQKYINAPIHILVDNAKIDKAILREIAYQIHKFAELEYDEDDNCPLLTFEKIVVETRIAYSSDNYGQYAIFHEEQECGYSWLIVSENDIDAPFTYTTNYSDIMRRVETNKIICKSR